MDLDWNYLFKSDLQKFSEQFQQLVGMGEHCKPAYHGFGGGEAKIFAKMLLKCKKIVYSSHFLE